MTKQFLAFIASLLLTGLQIAHACPAAAAVNSPDFCSSFRSVAQCHCVSHGLPARMCTDINVIYQRMLLVYSSMERACQHQSNTSPQNCINSWNCYRNGGATPDGELCSGTGASCA